MLWKSLGFVLFYCLASFPAFRANICDTLPENQLYTANSRGCAWYWSCIDRKKPREQRCPGSTIFDVSRQGCNHTDNIETACTIDEEMIRSATFECPNAHDFAIIPHPTECHKFTLCWNGEWGDIDCPDNTHFSIYENRCLPIEWADCDRAARFCTVHEHYKFLTNPRGCDNFFMCSECDRAHSLHSWDCPEGYKFSRDGTFCTKQDANFVCHIDSHPNFKPPAEPWTIDCADTSAGNYLMRPHPNDCRLYFICAHPSLSSILAECGPSLLFDAPGRRCMTEKDATCFNGNSTEI